MHAYVDAGKLEWPHNEGDTLPGALVHRSLQGGDFGHLRKGDPIWQNLDGSVTKYDGSHGEDVVPIFVNEAAYYSSRSGRGIGLCRAVEWDLTSGRANVESIL